MYVMLLILISTKPKKPMMEQVTEIQEMHSLGKGRRSVNQSQSPEQPQHFLIMMMVRNSKYRL